MLARRELARRPASIFRQTLVRRIPRRQLNGSPPRGNWQMTQPRGPGLYAQLRFQKNGTPRSLRWLLKSLSGFSLLYNLYLLKEMQVFGELVPVAYAMFFLLRIDTDYDRLNLNDPQATFDFLEKMFTLIGMERLGGKWTFDSLRDPQDRPEIIDKIMRNAVERIHQVLSRIARNREFSLMDYGEILGITSETFRRIRFAVFEPEEEELERQSPAHNRRASAKDVLGPDRTPEPPAEKAPPDYESIG